ncbi:hypothetical protein B0H34DRAFT_290830 [Crassisporium funariophilum]|nr:hypothetical protein B0H34DRAFT_290830 [Crassisporium funariophilum]
MILGQQLRTQDMSDPSKISTVSLNSMSSGLTVSIIKAALSQPIAGDESRSHSSYHSPPSIFEHIPIEIWQEIFLSSLQHEHLPELEELSGPVWGRTAFPPRGETLLPKTPPKLSHVCTLWRDVAFAMPELWDTLYINIFTRDTATLSVADIQERYNDTIHKRLSRAGERPLKICLVGQGNPADATTIVRSITQFSRKWETLHLAVPSESLYPLAGLESEDVPFLRSLKIFQYNWRRRDPMNPEQYHSKPNSAQFAFCDKAMKLRRLCISFCPPLTSAVWPRLQEINLQMTPSETWGILRVLKECVNLQVLTLVGFGITLDPPASEFFSLEMPNIHTLNLEHPVGRRWLLHQLSLPNLRHLTLRGSCEGQNSQIILHAMKDVLNRSSNPSLDTLTLNFDCHALELDVVLDFLARNPLLTELHIDDGTPCMTTNRPVINSGLLRALTLENASRDTGAAEYCPLLRRVKFVGCTGVSDEEVATFLQSRIDLALGKQEEIGVSTSTCLDAVEITMKRPSHSHTLDIVRKRLSDERVSISIHTTR